MNNFAGENDSFVKSFVERIKRFDYIVSLSKAFRLTFENRGNSFDYIIEFFLVDPAVLFDKIDDFGEFFLDLLNIFIGLQLRVKFSCLSEILDGLSKIL